MKEKLLEIAEKIKGLDPVEALRFFADQYPGKIVFSTSFGWEDQVISFNDLVLQINKNEPSEAFATSYLADVEAFYSAVKEKREGQI